MSNSAKPVRQKKSLRKQAAKKIRSQKRSVVPLKFFVLPAEKTNLENKAKESGCSLSNYIRLNLALAPNETGRKKQNIKPAFNIQDLELED